MKKTRKTVLAFITVCAVTVALIPSVCLSAIAAWSGGTAVPSMNTDGYYLIDSGEKLAWFSERVNSGYTTINAKQTMDLDLGGRAFTPIGTASNIFLGIYDGGGYTISGLSVTGTESVGLFGTIGATKTTQTLVDDWGDTYTENVYVPSEINNVVLVGACVSGTQNVGGIVGDSIGGSVTGCSVAGTVTGTVSATGGIVGFNRSGAVVSNCLNTATVSGAQRVGGVAGYCYSNAEVKGSCNEGTVNGTIYVGGLVGMSSGSTVHHAFNKGSITATNNQCGGLLGYVLYGEMYCMYTIGTVTCPGEYVGIAIGNVTYNTLVQRCYFDRDNTAMTDDYATPAEHALMVDESFLDTMNFDYEIFVNDYFRTNGGYPVLRWQLIAWDGSLAEPATDTSGVYIITNGSELAWFANLVNGTLSDVAQNACANAKLTRDILLNPPILTEDSNIWTPMGSKTAPYNGTFDGGEFRISGIYTTDSGNKAENVGLFGVIGATGVVQNLFVQSSEIEGQSAVGMIAGLNQGTINSCFNYGNVTGVYYGGGIVGINEKTVQNCGNVGDVSGNYHVGGIVGSNDGAGTIQSCFNNGTVTSPQRTGGIIGTNYGKIQYCYNGGRIVGGTAAGGIVGYQNSNISYGFYSCYSFGEVSGLNTSSGAVVGSFVNGSVYYCFYDSDRSGIGDTVATGQTTLEMAVPTTLTPFTGFSSVYWIDRGTDDYFDYYPELRVFYESDNNLLKTTSKESAAILKSAYAVMGKVDGEMNTYFETLALGSAHIGTGSGTLSLLRDLDILGTVNITGDVTITDNGTSRTVTRHVTMVDSLFNVEGVLTLKGSEDSATFCVNGGNTYGRSGESAVWVSETGTLVLESGAEIRNNTTTEKGGAVYIDGGTLQMNGGTLNGNQATNGGGIYNYAGILEAYGGTVSGNSANGNGGGICFEGKFAENTLDGVTVSDNTAINGGGFCNINSPVSFLSGSISNNTASLGGGAYNAGTLHIGGGTVSGNSATTGVGVLNNGALEMADEAYLASTDDIYLRTGKTVTNTAHVTTSGLIASLTAESYAVGNRVLSGDFCASNYAKYTLNVPSGQSELYINSTGYLVGREIADVATVSVFGSYDVAYTSLQEAVNAIGTGTGLIRMIGNDIVEDTIEINGHITIIGDESANRSITRYSTCTGAMFHVADGATLEFGAAGSENDAALIVDGGYALYGTYGTGIVDNDGTLILSDGASLKNASVEENGGAVNGVGAVEITGGRIEDCSAANGGAIYVTGGTVSVSGGTITNCSAQVSGGAIGAVGAALTMNGGTLSENEAVNGGAVWVGQTAVFAFEGGTITGNTATNGGGICTDGGTLTMQGGKNIVYQSDENGDIQAVEVDVFGTLSDNEAMVGGGADLLTGSASIIAGTISNNTAKYGAGIGIEENATCYLYGGSFSGGKANRGTGIYDAGTLYVRGTVTSADDVYLPSGNTIIPDGENVGCMITPSNYAIGTQLLSGDQVTALSSGFTITNDRFFITIDGKLDTDTLSLKETSAMHVDYTIGVIVGLQEDRNTPATVRGEFDNSASALVFVDSLGNPIAEDAPLGTNYAVRLCDASGTVIDSKSFALIGDVDCDGDFDGEDAVLVNCIIGGLTRDQIGAAAYRAADVTNDGVVNGTDVHLLRACGLLKAYVAQP